VPRILAVADVYLTAAAGMAEEVTRFYTELVGLDPLPAEEGRRCLVFQGYPRSGPRLLVSMLDRPRGPYQKRQLLVQVASLFDREQRMLDEGIPVEWSRGWSFYDRRLWAQDPAGNRIELVAYHVL
jgi:catechol-2,3-dioxygenase